MQKDRGGGMHTGSAWVCTGKHVWCGKGILGELEMFSGNNLFLKKKRKERKENVTAL